MKNERLLMELEREIEALKKPTMNAGEFMLRGLLMDASDEIKLLQSINEMHCTDWAEIDTAIREMAKPYIQNYDIEGDSYGVPSIEDIVERLVKMIPEGMKLV